MPLIAAALVEDDGTFISQRGFTGIVHVPASGLYVLTLANPPADLNNLVVEVTQGGTVAGQEAASFGLPDLINVRTFDAAGVLTDRIFMITVYDLT